MGSFLETIKMNWPEKTVEFPGTAKKIRMRLLNLQDLLDASLAADKLYASEKIEIRAQNVSDYEREKDIQRLYRALRDLEDNKPLSDSITGFRLCVSPEERDCLVDEYNSFALLSAPKAGILSAERKDVLLSELESDAKKTIAEITDLNELRALCSALAEKSFAQKASE